MELVICPINMERASGTEKPALFYFDLHAVNYISALVKERERDGEKPLENWILGVDCANMSGARACHAESRDSVQPNPGCAVCVPSTLGGLRRQFGYLMRTGFKAAHTF